MMSVCVCGRVCVCVLRFDPLGEREYDWRWGVRLTFVMTVDDNCQRNCHQRWAEVAIEVLPEFVAHDSGKFRYFVKATEHCRATC